MKINKKSLIIAGSTCFVFVIIGGLALVGMSDVNPETTNIGKDSSASSMEAAGAMNNEPEVIAEPVMDPVYVPRIGDMPMEISASSSNSSVVMDTTMNMDSMEVSMENKQVPQALPQIVPSRVKVN